MPFNSLTFVVLLRVRAVAAQRTVFLAAEEAKPPSRKLPILRCLESPVQNLRRWSSVGSVALEYRRKGRDRQTPLGDRANHRWKRTDMLICGVELGLETFGRWHERPFTPRADHVLSVPLNVYLLADNVRLGVRCIPDNTSGINNGSTWSVSVGFADLNGLLYWGLGRFRRSEEEE